MIFKVQRDSLLMHSWRSKCFSSSKRHLVSSPTPTTNVELVHPAMVKRVNKFVQPIPALLRNFKNFRAENFIDISAKVFNSKLRVDLIHRVVHWNRAKRRAGTASTKHRGDVRGSTRKIHPQKGTGKARAGSSRAPHRRGGGRCFGPKPRSYYYPLSPKVRNAALRAALSVKFKQGQLCFVDEKSLELSSHRTCTFATYLDRISKKRILLVDSEEASKNFMLASRNLKARFAFKNISKNPFDAYHAMDNQILIITNRARSLLETKLSS